ncbi:ATP-binding protein [Xanthomonas vesicatoria]|uniref:ATP-binding protein n=1 Tax=Xanthomonas vesicatoria TaxID=56460 RepID=UPI003558C26E
MVGRSIKTCRCAWRQSARRHFLSGKTWLACALAVQAARQGITVGYRRVGRLLEDMEIGHADGSLAKLRNQLARTGLLILDDFVSSPVKQTQ